MVVRKPSSHFVHTTTVFEPETIKFTVNLVAAAIVAEKIVTVDVRIHRPETQGATTVTQYRKGLSEAVVKQKLYILEEPTTTISESVTLNIKKVCIIS